MKSVRTLFAVMLAATMAFPSMAAAERVRPTNLYLSTGSADSDCSPTELTTRATGSGNCGPVSPMGGSTTWKSSGLDEGYPFAAAAQTATVTISIQDGTGLGVPGDYDITVDVSLETDEGDLTVTHSEAFDASTGDMVIEFDIEIPADTFVYGGSVTVAGDGLGLPVGYAVNGSGGSFIRIMPPTEA